MVRCEPDAAASLLGGNVQRMVMRGGEMADWLRVTGELSDADLDRWAGIGVAYMRAHPKRG